MRTLLLSLVTFTLLGTSLAAQVERVIIQKIVPGGEPITKELKGPEARKITTAFDAISLSGIGKRCHFPAYQIDAFDRTSRLYALTICWACDNVKFIEPQDQSLQGFDPSKPEVRRLREALDNLFSR